MSPVQQSGNSSSLAITSDSLALEDLKEPVPPIVKSHRPPLGQGDSRQTADRMGNVGAKIVVELSSPSYYAGSLMEGRVYLGVEKERVDCAQLRIKFQGEEKVEIRRTRREADNRSTNHRYRESSVFFNYDEQIANFSEGFVRRGRYEFPFFFHVPPNLPSTFEISVLRCKCILQYTLEVRLDRPGWTHFDVVHRIPVYIVGVVPLPPIRPLIRGPYTRSLKSCFTNPGDLMLAGMIDKDFVVPGDEIKAYFVISNCSTKTITSLSVALIEHTHARAQHATRSFSRTLFQVSVRPEHIANCREPPGVTMHMVLDVINVAAVWPNLTFK